jgi:hypothetical protein
MGTVLRTDRAREFWTLTRSLRAKAAQQRAHSTAFGD